MKEAIASRIVFSCLLQKRLEACFSKNKILSTIPKGEEPSFKLTLVRSIDDSIQLKGPFAEYYKSGWNYATKKVSPKEFASTSERLLLKNLPTELQEDSSKLYHYHIKYMTQIEVLLWGIQIMPLSEVFKTVPTFGSLFPMISLGYGSKPQAIEEFVDSFEKVTFSRPLGLGLFLLTLYNRLFRVQQRTLVRMSDLEPELIRAKYWFLRLQLYRLQKKQPNDANVTRLIRSLAETAEREEILPDSIVFEGDFHVPKTNFTAATHNPLLFTFKEFMDQGGTAKMTLETRIKERLRSLIFLKHNCLREDCAAFVDDYYEEEDEEDAVTEIVPEDEGFPLYNNIDELFDTDTILNKECLEGNLIE